MGKQLDLLRKLIKEELDIALRESESLNEAELAAAEWAANELFDSLLFEEDLTEGDLDEANKGRPEGTGKLYKITSNYTADEVKKFLRQVVKLIDEKNEKKGRGAKAKNFTEEDIENFGNVLAQKDGFTREEVMNSISFYKGKEPQAAQKLFDVLGDPKVVGKEAKEDEQLYLSKLEKAEEEGNTELIKALKKDIKDLKTGKGYIELVGTIKAEKPETKKAPEDKEVVNTDSEEVDAEEIDDKFDVVDDDNEFDDEEAGLEIDTDIEGGSELAQLKQQLASNMAVLAPKIKQAKETGSLKSYSEENKDLIAQNKELKADIERLEREMAADLDVEEDEDEMINESLVYMFQKRAGLLNG